MGMTNKTASSARRDQTAIEFANAHVEVADTLSADPAAAVQQLKEAFKYDERQSIVDKIYNLANGVTDPLLRTDCYSFVATHTAKDAVKEYALEGAVKALELASRGQQSDRSNHEGIASRTLDVFGVLTGNITQSFGICSQLMEIWHKQITALLEQDEVAKTFSAKAFIGQQIVKRTAVGLDEFTSGILTGAFERIIEAQKPDAHRAKPAANTTAEDARARLIAKAWHGANPSGQCLQ